MMCMLMAFSMGKSVSVWNRTIPKMGRRQEKAVPIAADNLTISSNETTKRSAFSPATSITIHGRNAVDHEANHQGNKEKEARTIFIVETNQKQQSIKSRRNLSKLKFVMSAACVSTTRKSNVCCSSRSPVRDDQFRQNETTICTGVRMLQSANETRSRCMLTDFELCVHQHSQCVMSHARFPMIECALVDARTSPHVNQGEVTEIRD